LEPLTASARRGKRWSREMTRPVFLESEMRFIKALLALFLLVVAATCGKNETGPTGAGGGGGGKPVKIGFIVKQPEEPWFQLEWKFAEQAAKEDGFELIKIGAPDGEKVSQAIQSLSVNGAQGFIICTPQTTLGPAIVSDAKERGLKVIAVDDQFVGADKKPMTNVHYLGISARKIGESVGHALVAEMKKRNWAEADTALCVVTFEELETARDRTNGAMDAVKADAPGLRQFKTPQKTSDLPGAMDASLSLLTQQGGVKHWLICGMNDSAVMGAVRATESRGFKAEDVIGIGINGTECIGEFERPTPTGFFASALLSAKQHGHDTAHMMYQWIKEGKEPPLDTRTVGVMINRDNFKQVLKEQGIRD
jgi:L-arabinose transport system substrate-binding protein